MAGTPPLPNAVSIPLHVPLPLVLERLQAASSPPKWYERWLKPHLVCHIGPQDLYVRRSHTYRSLGTVAFRASIDSTPNTLTGAFERTAAGTAFLAVWTLIWLVGLVAVWRSQPLSTPTGQDPPRWTTILVCLACLAVVPLLARVPRSDRHPQRGWLMCVLRAAASASAA